MLHKGPCKEEVLLVANTAAAVAATATATAAAVAATATATAAAVAAVAAADCAIP
ncbi:hypothetical protein LOAG_04755 [Loa loa]|uniref:Uncharacterized protein n=1 Tax=Loa loa TaxID=7209 RepID=A0A1S0U1Z2_LOALO|nr:hypothetical protein LOAG_04755 [Loa loa]EFO23735.1 hypothetical protein LOAG_04755 [Loa loa]